QARRVRHRVLPGPHPALRRPGHAPDRVQRRVRHPRRHRRGEPGPGRADGGAGQPALARRRPEAPYAHRATAAQTPASTGPAHNRGRPHHPPLSMRQRLLRLFDQLQGTDFTRTRPFVWLAVAFFAVRLPFVGYGHGTDPDAWRVAMTARYLLETGDYFPSR